MVPMEAHELLSVESENGASLRGRKREHLFIRHGEVCLAGFERGQHIMTDLPEFLNTKQREVLVE